MKGLFLVILSVLICGCWSTDPDLEEKVVKMEYSLVLDVVEPTTETTDGTTGTEDGSGDTDEPTETTEPPEITGSTETSGTDEATGTTETTPEVTTAESDPLLNDTDIMEIKEWLVELYFNGTTGFLNIPVIAEQNVISSFAAEVNITYTLEYSLKILSDENLLPSDNSDRDNSDRDNSDGETIFDQIEEVQKTIAKGTGFPTEFGFEVNQVNTSQDNEAQRKAEETKIAGASCALASCIREEVCLIESGSIDCEDKCFLFNQTTGCAEEGILQTGECKLDNYYNPYCDCGKCGLLDNFYDAWGEQCVNSCLVVGATAGGVGLILIILIISIACVASDRNSKAKQLSQYEEIQKNAMDSKAWPVNPEDGLDPLTQSVHEDEDGAEPNPESRAQTPKSGRSARSGAEAREEGSTQGPPPRELANGGGVRSLGTDTSDLPGGSDRGSVRRSTYDNKAYQQENDPAYADLLREYENFEPQLNHIDPYVDYKISRPMLTENKY